MRRMAITPMVAGPAHVVSGSSPRSRPDSEVLLEMLGRGRKPYGVSEEEISGHSAKPRAWRGAAHHREQSEGLKYAGRRRAGRAEEWANIPTGFRAPPARHEKPARAHSGLGGATSAGAGLIWAGAEPSQSAKDTFLHYGSNASWMRPPRRCGAVVQRVHKPGMEAQGYKVYAWRAISVDWDARRTQWAWFDYLINAGGENPELGWQPQGGDESVGTSAARRLRRLSDAELDLGLNDLMGNTTAQQIIALLQDLSERYPRDLLLKLLGQ